MKLAYFKYKCRLCGKEFSGGEIKSSTQAYCYLRGLCENRDFDEKPPFFSVHLNCEKGFGLGDLLGASADK